MKTRFLLAAIVTIVGLGVVQTVGAQDDLGPSIGPVPDGGERPITEKDLPDLIPLVDGAGVVVGYLRSDEVFVDLFDPKRELAAATVYERDGETIIGYELPEQGFVDATSPIATSHPAPVPERLAFGIPE